jgi:outer membrane receptor protein involved in Fe transport
LFANYSYQSLRDDDPSTQTTAPSAPRHKVNAGGRLKRGGFTAGLWADWVDQTFWNASAPGSPISYGKVPDYLLLNGRVGYEFGGRWEGWEAGVSAFNLAARRHYEMLPANGSQPGQNAEIVRSRWTGTLSYRFH